jgi:hypothetical protein
MSETETKIFLNNMNTWLSKYTIERFRNDKDSHFMGTCNSGDCKLPANFIPRIIKIDSKSHYENEIFGNDVYIFNLDDTDYSDIEYIIKGLKTLKHKTVKTLIIISSIMTWARSNPKIKVL